MNKVVTERVDKFNIISSFCAGNADIVASIPAFKRSVEYLDIENAAIKKRMIPLLLPVTGTAADKSAAKKAASALLDPLCGALMGFADEQKNQALKAQANFTKSTLESIRDEDMVQTCNALIALAGTHLSALADYGYTQKDLDQASAAIVVFKELNPQPLGTVAEDKAEREALMERSAALNNFVAKQFRNTAKRFKITHPEFFDKLENTMRSQHKGIRHRLSDEEKAARKLQRQQVAAEKKAQEAATKAAKEAEALAKAAALQLQTGNEEQQKTASEPEQGTPATNGEGDAPEAGKE